MESYLDKARAIMEAMPYIQRFSGSTVVIKYGGHAMDDPQLKEHVIRDIILMKLVGIKIIVVHGGGPHITDMMRRLGKEAEFLNGHRVTDSETMDITEMVLSGHINKDIVSLINANGGEAIGISGRDGNLIQAVKKRDVSGQGLDFGQVGVIDGVDPAILIKLTQAGYIPVVSPVAGSPEGHAYNVNADSAAGFIAGALTARRLVFMTDVKGLYRDINDQSTFIQSIKEKEITALIKDKTIAGGMIPKVESGLQALHKGVEKAHILDGRMEHALILELFTSAGIGTEITV